MDRTACVDIPSLALQLLRSRHAEWRQYPVAVVDRDAPEGKILQADERARRQCILPGMRYAAALSQCGDLRAAEVPATEIEAATESVLQVLQQFTPRVEPARDAGQEGLAAGLEDTAFWLDASGLAGRSTACSAAPGGFLYGSLRGWAGLVHAALAAQNELEATVVVGFRRFETWAVARSGSSTTRRQESVVVFESREEERAAAHAVPLVRLALPPRAREVLERLGVTTVGALAALPEDGVRRRFDADTARLDRWARGGLEAPLAPWRIELPLEASLDLEYAEADIARLVILIGRLLHTLLEELARRDKALVTVEIRLGLDGGGRHEERLRPAAPTLELAQLTGLIHLRLSARPPPAGVVEVSVNAEGARRRSEQLELFVERPRRDAKAADRALARLRAELGDEAVLRAKLCDGHLPEASFAWERAEHVPTTRAQPEKLYRGTLIRRLHECAWLLPPRPRHEPDGWMLKGLEEGPVIRVRGPYIISGGWWRGPATDEGCRALHREYHFAETQHGEILWVYWDRRRRRWLIQGRVE